MNFAPLTKPLCALVFLTLFVTVTGFGLAFQGGHIGGEDLAALAIYASTGLAIVLILVEKDHIALDLSRPLNLFAIFYFFYYVVPNWISIIADAEAKRNSLEIALLTATGFAFFTAGIKLVKIPADGFYLSPSQTRALIVLCKITIVLLIWYYAWHISIGAFYTHAKEYVQETTVFAGLMENLIGPLQAPLPLVLGLALRSSQGEQAIRVKRLLYFYTGGSIFVYAMSSQFRPLATAFLFCIASLNIAQKRLVKFRAYFLSFAVSAGMLVLILAVRSIAIHQDWSQSNNQLSDSASAALSSGGTDQKVNNETFNRALNQVNLLSQVVSETNNGHPYLYGDLLLSSAYSIVPRAFWPGKPTVTPMQIMLRLEFNLTAKDDAAGPLLEAYANGGWVAVIAAFMGLGYLSGKLTRFGANASILSVLLLSWWWGVVTIMEQELLLSLLSGLRMILIVACAAWLIRKVSSLSMRYYAKGVTAGILLPFAWVIAQVLVRAPRGRSISSS